MQLNKFEFLGYEHTLDDKYIIGIATVKVMVPVILKYKKVKTKNGDGTFFTSPSYTIDNHGEKKYVNSHMLDSRADEEILLDLIRKKSSEKSLELSANYNAILPLSNKTCAPTYEEPLPF